VRLSPPGAPTRKQGALESLAVSPDGAAASAPLGPSARGTGARARPRRRAAPVRCPGSPGGRCFRQQRGIGASAAVQASRTRTVLGGSPPSRCAARAAAASSTRAATACPLLRSWPCCWRCLPRLGGPPQWLCDSCADADAGGVPRRAASARSAPMARRTAPARVSAPGGYSPLHGPARRPAVWQPSRAWGARSGSHSPAPDVSAHAAPGSACRGARRLKQRGRTQHASLDSCWPAPHTRRGSAGAPRPSRPPRRRRVRRSSGSAGAVGGTAAAVVPGSQTPGVPVASATQAIRGAPALHDLRVPLRIPSTREPPTMCGGPLWASSS